MNFTIRSWSLPKRKMGFHPQNFVLSGADAPNHRAAAERFVAVWIAGKSEKFRRMIEVADSFSGVTVRFVYVDGRFEGGAE